MREHHHRLWESFQETYWFTPTLMTVGSVLLSVVTVYIDRQLPHDWVRWVDPLWGGGAEGARAVLSAIGSSVITVAGVVFSVTIVALTLASQRFGPHVLRSFLRDTGNKVTLGFFLGTFVYCLLVLRLVRAGVFIPGLSVFVALLLALTDVGMLIYFIDHISASIQAETLAASVGREFARLVNVGYPAGPHWKPEGNPGPLREELEGEPATVRAKGSGYLQAFFYEELLRVATDSDLVIKLLRQPGEFVIEGGPLALGWPAERCPPETIERIAEAVMLGPYRTVAQDVKYPVDQLVEIALIALSPGVNDTFTALICVDWLSAGLTQLAKRAPPACHVLDYRGRPRLIVEQPTFHELAEAAFNEIRKFATVPVALRLLEKIAKIAEHTSRPEDRVVLRQQADLIREAGERKPWDWRDLGALEDRHRLALAALAGEVTS